MMIAVCLAVVLPTGLALAAGKGKGGEANTSCGAYCANPNDTSSQNKNHQDGSVGKADNKNPKGQAPNGSDNNKGYECDGNPGIGNGNPAHTVNCPSTSPTVEPTHPSPQGPKIPKETPSANPTNTPVVVLPTEIPLTLPTPVPSVALPSPPVVKTILPLPPVIMGPRELPRKTEVPVEQKCGGAPITLQDNSPSINKTNSDTPTAGTLPFTGINSSLYIGISLLLIGLGILSIAIPTFLTNRKFV